MNTRLQVEHPVTELVTCLDLVELMIRSAAGERLPIGQGGVRQAGWAIESRILAEDPARNFLPSTGRLRSYREPHEVAQRGATLRIDSGVREGAEISIHYDPLIAKLVTHAPDRAAAIHAQAEALDSFVIEGPSTNIAFLSAVMAHERFRRGAISTGFIAEEYPKAFVPELPEEKIARLFASVAAAVDQVTRERRRAISGQLRGGDHVSASAARTVMLGKTRFDVQVERRADGDGVAVRFETGEMHVCTSLWRPGEAVWRGAYDGKQVAVKLRPVLNGHILMHDGAAAEARVYSRREAELAALMPEKKTGAGANVLRSPMPALVKAIAVVVGEEVKTGEPLCVIEAMKMEMVLRAGRDVTVRKINVAPGDSIAVDSILMSFE
jgi:propionyl-CoA carboxylase alpha chain